MLEDAHLLQQRDLCPVSTTAGAQLSARVTRKHDGISLALIVWVTPEDRWTVMGRPCPRIPPFAGSGKGFIMRKVVAFSLTLALGLTTMAAMPVGAADNLKPCNQAETIDGGTYGNVYVPAGGTCVLENVTLTGNFRADGAADAQIILSTIQGDVLIENAAIAQLGWSRVAGDVRFEGNGERDTLSWAIRGNTIGGDCTATGNVGQREVTGNIVEGNVSGQCRASEWPRQLPIGAGLSSR